MKLEDFADKKPEFKLEEYFLGKTTASGLFIDLFGKVKRQFTVEMEGIQEGDVFILNETFLYDNGEEEFRRWEITKTGERTYEGNSSDILCVAK